MKLALWLLALLSFTANAEARFSGAEVADDGRSLVLRTASGAEVAPALPDQVAFAMPRISMDGQYAGWLALFPNCCTSYPVPLVLVVVGPNGSLHRFQGDQATFAWCFATGGEAVVYRRSALHGPGPEQYEMRRIDDGTLLRSHGRPIVMVDGSESETGLPQWAECAAD